MIREVGLFLLHNVTTEPAQQCNETVTSSIPFDGCVITVVFLIGFGQGDHPYIGFSFYIIEDQ
ncbi:hypothetical protein [Aneurinibacillus uraniidurans]|uniref:hypothetical protein n=1 Tax=Aneurinibacillus uraniidurans TaxID=2966586 RepID=UPI00234BD577|nr:hypothetical protein [Aneurinibacillus sp. B1]WCN39352.1 hypothetical protein PO771_08150 [Aneurinibacillus sp. B1]